MIRRLLVMHHLNNHHNSLVSIFLVFLLLKMSIYKQHKIQVILPTNIDGPSTTIVYFNSTLPRRIKYIANENVLKSYLYPKIREEIKGKDLLAILEPTLIRSKPTCQT